MGTKRPSYKEEHISQIQLFIASANESTITLSMKKCGLSIGRIDHLGHVVRQEANKMLHVLQLQYMALND